MDLISALIPYGIPTILLVFGALLFSALFFDNIFDSTFLPDRRVLASRVGLLFIVIGVMLFILSVNRTYDVGIIEGRQTAEAIQNPTIEALHTRLAQSSIIPIPTAMTKRIIADFDSSEDLSPDTVQGFGDFDHYCTSEVTNNEMKIAPIDRTKWAICRLSVQPKADRKYNEIGSLSATLRSSQIEEKGESWALIQLVTYFKPDVELSSQCGFRQISNDFVGMFSVTSKSRSGSPITCPPESADQDGSDGVCEMYFHRFESIEVGNSYNFDLVANPVSTNEFQCFVNGTGVQYWVNTWESNLVETLENQPFERYVDFEFAPNTQMSYYLEELSEGK